MEPAGRILGEKPARTSGFRIRSGIEKEDCAIPWRLDSRNNALVKFLNVSGLIENDHI